MPDPVTIARYRTMDTKELVDLARAFIADMQTRPIRNTVEFCADRVLMIVEELDRRFAEYVESAGGA